MCTEQARFLQSSSCLISGGELLCSMLVKVVEEERNTFCVRCLHCTNSISTKLLKGFVIFMDKAVFHYDFTYQHVLYSAHNYEL